MPRDAGGELVEAWSREKSMAKNEGLHNTSPNVGDLPHPEGARVALGRRSRTRERRKHMS